MKNLVDLARDVRCLQADVAELVRCLRGTGMTTQERVDRIRALDERLNLSIEDDTNEASQ